MRRRDPREDALRERLTALRPEDESGALDRAIAVAATERGQAGATRRRRASRLVLSGLAATAAAVALVLTPAGAQVREWVGEAVDTGPDDAVRGALSRVPSGGSLLVSSGSQHFTVGEDGSANLLGAFADATWSPNGGYVAAADGSALVALEPDGDLRWRVSAPDPVEDPAWGPGCCRVGYRSGDALFVVDGDGTDVRELARDVAPVAPQWMPVPYDIEEQDSPNVLAYVDGDGRLRTVDADTGAQSKPVEAPADPLSLAWLDRDRVVIAGARTVAVADLPSASARTARLPLRGEIAALDASPARAELALLTEAGGPAAGSRVRSNLLLVRLGGDGQVLGARSLFSGLGRYDGPVFSPDGSRIELGWREADQWRFIPRERGADPVAIGGITRQFDPALSRAGRIPRIEDWCCP